MFQDHHLLQSFITIPVLDLHLFTNIAMPHNCIITFLVWLKKVLGSVVILPNITCLNTSVKSRLWIFQPENYENTWVHTILTDARFLLVPSKDTAYFSLITAYVTHGDLVSLCDFVLLWHPSSKVTWVILHSSHPHVTFVIPDVTVLFPFIDQSCTERHISRYFYERKTYFQLQKTANMSSKTKILTNLKK